MSAAVKIAKWVQERPMILIRFDEEDRQEGGRDWLFRPDQQLRDEITRMQIPAFEGSLNDYR